MNIWQVSDHYAMFQENETLTPVIYNKLTGEAWRFFRNTDEKGKITINNNSAVLILSAGVITIRMEVVKEEGIWKVDGWKEVEKAEGKKVAI